VFICRLTFEKYKIMFNVYEFAYVSEKVRAFEVKEQPTSILL